MSLKMFANSKKAISQVFSRYSNSDFTEIKITEILVSCIVVNCQNFLRSCPFVLDYFLISLLYL